MNLKDKNILITGGLGFIGSNLSERLTKLKAKVQIYDLANGDNILDNKKLSKIVNLKFDIIYHLAGYSGSKESNENIEKSFKINTLGTVNLCESIIRFSPNTKLFLSSSRLEYGVPKYLPVDENHPTNPTSAYGLSKLTATQTALIYSKKNKLDVTIFRTSNVYGPHITSKFQGYNIINHFIDLAKKNKLLTIFGDGTQERDYIYIDDLVEAFLLAIYPIINGKIYNLGFGEGIKFKDMTNLITQVIGRGKLKFIKWPKDSQGVETGNYITDITKIRRELGFKPKVGFKEGIRKTINNKL